MFGHGAAAQEGRAGSQGGKELLRKVKSDSWSLWKAVGNGGKVEDKARRLAQPPVILCRDSPACGKIRLKAGNAQKHLREQIGQLWGKTHFTVDALL